MTNVNAIKHYTYNIWFKTKSKITFTSKNVEQKLQQHKKAAKQWSELNFHTWTVYFFALQLAFLAMIRFPNFTRSMLVFEVENNDLKSFRN